MNTCGQKGVHIFGPKGLGKTRALQELCRTRPGSLFLDLAKPVKGTQRSTSSWLFLDNAQCYTNDQIGPLVLAHKRVVAAYSPGVAIEDKQKTLSKTCGDGKNMKFYWRPFTLKETQKLCFNHKKLKPNECASIHQRCAGNPRHIAYSVNTGQDSLMIQELMDQFKSIISEKTSKAVGKTIHEICLHIISSFAQEKQSVVLDILGCSYNSKWDGTGAWKTANPYYVFSAIHYVGGTDYICGERWQQLEVLTTLVLNCSDVTLNGCRGSIDVAKSTTVHMQTHIGDQISPTSGVVTMLKLASGHNLIDSIVYDMRRHITSIYFIQTSLMSYNKGLIEVS